MERSLDIRPDSPRLARARPWPLAVGLAIFVVYGAQLLPLAATDLLDHGHCLATYARFFPVLVGLGPGVSARVWSGLGEPAEEWVLLVVAVAVTGTLLGGSALALRRWRRGGAVVALLAGTLSAMLSMFAVAILRA